MSYTQVFFFWWGGGGAFMVVFLILSSLKSGLKFLSLDYLDMFIFLDSVKSKAEETSVHQPSALDYQRRYKTIKYRRL